MLALWVIYTTYKKFKVQIISILEEIDSFYWQKMHIWKDDIKIGEGPPPPLIWTKSKRTAIFSRETLPKRKGQGTGVILVPFWTCELSLVSI